ncbi:MAG: tetratricopeptide repeat protein [Planctomycetota bacterium]
MNQSAWPRLLYLLPLAAVISLTSQRMAWSQETPPESGATTATESVSSDDQTEADSSGDGETEDAGQADLDEATVLRIDARSAREFQAVQRLLESAIEKGLTGENAAFAKEMLGSVLLQKSQQIIGAMAQAPGGRPLQMRDEALRVLDQAVEYDPGLVEAYILIARLNMLPGGDKDAISEATSKAIELLEDNPVERSAALALRALTWGAGQEDKRIADLDAAVKDDPKNLEARKARAAIRLQGGDVEGAVADMEAVLEQDPTNQQVAQAVVEKLAELGRLDDALKLLSTALETKPSEGLYRMRAIVHRMRLEEDEAFADLNKALAMQPRDPIALLQRAEIAVGRKEIQAAKDDLRAAEKITPQVTNATQTVWVRCLIAIEEGRMADAINEMQTLISREPDNDVRKLQLANLYLSDDRPRQAIEILTPLIEQDPGSVSMLRSRADAYLAVGDHKEAIVDYEAAIKAADESGSSFDLSGVLNNLAWVLATSPDDSIRNGERSVELGKRAVELTNESEPHILSTLAAGFAEAGDFEKAREWSEKSVKLGREKKHDQIEQLEAELESYRADKPWREKQDTEENETPILSPEDLIDT